MLAGHSCRLCSPLRGRDALATADKMPALQIHGILRQALPAHRAARQRYKSGSLSNLAHLSS